VSATHVNAAFYWDGAANKPVLEDPVLFMAQMRRMKWGHGERGIARFESEAEAWRHSDVKHLFGHIYLPVIKYGETGYTRHELHLVEKAEWMPDDGRTSITQLNREELREFSLLSDRHLREEFPDAFEIWEAEQRLKRG
jgi:hypothetical protein